MIVASVFLIYTFLGPMMPSIIAHKGNSLSEVVNHQWITTQGVFGIALGGWIGYLIAGFIGACILIAIARMLRRAT